MLNQFVLVTVLFGSLTINPTEVQKKEVREVRETFTVVVDYNKGFQEAVSAGRYDQIDELVKEDIFPFFDQEQGKKEVKFRLFHFGRFIGSDEAIYRMENDGFRPATLRELLALGEVNPKLQRRFLIVALGTSFSDLNGEFVYGEIVPILAKINNRRMLGVGWKEVGWDGSCRFLGVWCPEIRNRFSKRKR